MSILSGRLTAARGHAPLAWWKRCLADLASSRTEASVKRYAWQVSSCGRVRSSKGLVSFGSILSSGYRRVAIDGRFYYVHRLVAAGFLPLPNTCQWQVNHLDRDPSNNHVSNLQYVSPAENIQHTWQTNPARKGPGKPVMWRIVGQDVWFTCATQAQAASQLGVSALAVSQCCSGVSTSIETSRGTRHEVRWVDLPHKQRPISAVGEQWRDAKHPNTRDLIPGWMVSSCGRVWSSRRGQISQGSRHGAGYFKCKARSQDLLIHRIVAASFLEEPDSSLEVNHKDGDPGNNHVENLEYVTHSENMRHSYLRRALPHRQPGQCKTVQGRRLSFEGPWLDFESVQAAALHAGVSSASVSNICHGRKTRCKDWEFRFVHEEPLPGEEWRKVCPAVLERARTASAVTGDGCALLTLKPQSRPTEKCPVVVRS
ncbi:unnamed protein product [Symbiodinium natans]|uniref:HNH nuclease domain-containing protein n=1 Tax=Symbiodinium natans TaxID=878477 RepID=A0A812PWW0_9DINO|nr:unnamed protein product [Symbiodinium natans]